MKKIAFVGCTHIHTPNFVKFILADKDIIPAAVWDPAAARAAAVAAELGCQVANSAASIWGNAAIDAVVICSETRYHAELAIAAARSGKAVFVEKPLGFAANDAYEAAAEIEKSGVIFQTGYFNRSRAVLRFLKAQVESGTFGKINRFHFANCHSGSLGGWFDDQWRWMADPAVAGCGAFGDMGTHALDIMMWMFGRPTGVSAEISVITGRYGDCDETGAALLRFPGGEIGVLSAGWTDVANPTPLLLSGSTGCAWLVDKELFVKCAKLPGADGTTPWTALPDELPHAFILFLDAVAGRPVGLPLVSSREAADRSAVMAACYRSAATGRREKPDYR